MTSKNSEDSSTTTVQNFCSFSSPKSTLQFFTATLPDSKYGKMPKCAQNVPQFHLGLSPHKFYIDCKNGGRPKPSPNAANCSILKDTHVFMCIRRPPLAKGGSTLSYTYRWADFWCCNNKDIDRGAGAALKPTLANLRLSLQAKFAETWRI